MLFKTISYRIAWQFTAFVFVLMLVNGALFLAADIVNARRHSHVGLMVAARDIQQRMSWQDGNPGPFPKGLHERARILDASGAEIRTGELLSGLPFAAREGIVETTIQGEKYRILTFRLSRNGQERFVQVADIERLPIGDLPERCLIYLLVTSVISALTFMVGLFFARKSMKPAEQMMERLEQFTQDASHELRTPLAALNSSLDLALKTKKYHEGIVSAKEDVKQITSLAERLLELARLDQLVINRETVDLSGLVERSVERHQSLAKECGIIMTSAIAPHITVQGDAPLLQQVLTNLLSNAIKFGKKSGRIQVRLTSKELSVEDDGSGIAAGDLPHIFDRFYQADASRTHGGFGLGLSLVKRIVDLHGWEVAVKSEEGVGTTFVIHL